MEVDAETLDHVISTDAAQVTVSGEPKIGETASRDRGVFVEVLDKHDTVLHRTRYEHLPITIGNAYRCDHIVDSDQPSAQSVTLAHHESGALIVRGTNEHAKVNANAKFWAPGGNTTEWIVDPDRAFLVAGERIRVRTRDYVPSRRLAQPSAIAWLGGWTTLIAVAAALGLTALQGWLADIDGERLSKYITGALGIFGAIAIWSGLWAVVSRLNGKSSHFLAHLSLASLGLVAIALIDFAFDSASFAFNLVTLSKYGYVLFAACIGALVGCHTRYIVRTKQGAAMSTALAVGIAMLVLQATTFFNLRGGFASSLTMNEMRPPGWRLVEGATINEFFATSAELEKRAEKSKAEKPEGADYGSYGE